MIRNTLLVIVGFMLISPVMAEDFAYEGKIKGMSCAFCVYKVSKNIKTIPGVKPGSVNVDLKSGKLNLQSTKEIKVSVVEKLVTSAGFKLSNFKVIKAYQPVAYKKIALVTIKLESLDLKTYNSLLEKMGDIAAAEIGKLVIQAPKSIEIDLLKILIAGRQKVARVVFTESKNKTIEISIFQKP